MKSTVYLDVLISFNKFATIMQVFKRFPLLSPFQYLLVPFGKLRAFANMEKTIRQGVRRRIEQKDSIEHPDWFQHIVPVDTRPPTSKRELTHVGSVSMQVMFAQWGPMADWFYGTLLFLLDEPECYKLLAEEIRNAFKSYEDIEPRALMSLPYLHACLEESLRMLPSNNTGLPRLSPGAVVDGHYVPKGVRALAYPKLQACC